MSEVNRNMKEKKLFGPTFKQTASRTAQAVLDKAAPGVRLNRKNLDKEPSSKHVVDTTTMSKAERSQYNTESKINQYVYGGVNRSRKRDRRDSY